MIVALKEMSVLTLISGKGLKEREIAFRSAQVLKEVQENPLD